MNDTSYTPSRRVRSPRGRLIPVRTYLALVRGQEIRSTAHPCEYAHYGCAAWDGGPCSDEIAGALEANGFDA